jgi:tetratricopeptide (TPR) repeat protein
MAGEFDGAIDRCRHVLDMDPGFQLARRILGAALIGAGQPQQAVKELESTADSDNISLAWLAHAKALAGAREDAAALVDRLDAAAGSSYVPGYHLALAHTGLGNRDRAFELLRRAGDERDPSLVNVAVEPRFEPLRQDPRYASLLTGLGLAFRR